MSSAATAATEAETESAVLVVVCRVCLLECADYKALHKKGYILGKLTTLASLLHYCTNLEFPVDEDFLPKYMCTGCVRDLAHSYVFKKKVLETNEFLRNPSKIGDIEAIAELKKEQHQTNPNIIAAEDLEELANAAQIKRAMDNMEYVLTVEQQECTDEEEVQMEQEVHMEEDERNVDHNENNEEVEVVEETEVTLVRESCHNENEVEPELEEQIKVEDDEGFETATYIITVPDTTQDDSTTDSHLNESREPLKTRQRIHSGREPYGESKARKVVKTRNIHPKPANPSFRCEVCGKQLSNSNSFKYHMQLHSDATPFLCSLCGEGFKTRNAYEGHIVIHDPNNPNTCDMCGKTYRQSSSLRTHMLSHTGEKPFQCDICGKGMTQKSGYKKHMLTHTGEKPHTCDICGRNFRYSSNLIAHKRCHTGEKPYDCPFCHKLFPTSEQMKRHTVVHTGDRPFCCNFCGRKFKRRSSLLTHRHTHDGANEGYDQKLTKSNVVEIY